MTRLSVSAAKFSAADEERKFGDIANSEAAQWLDAFDAESYFNNLFGR
jgi:hypothetical protein